MHKLKFYYDEVFESNFFPGGNLFRGGMGKIEM